MSTLFISISKVVHLRFPLYQPPHTKLFIKKFHIIDIHKKSCSLKNFHFIKTHKQFFSFPLYQYPPKSCCNNLAPLSPHKFSLIMSLTQTCPMKMLLYLSTLMLSCGIAVCGLGVQGGWGQGVATAQKSAIRSSRKIWFPKGVGGTQLLLAKRIFSPFDYFFGVIFFRRSLTFLLTPSAKLQLSASLRE